MDPEIDLVEQFKRGNKKAFTAIYEKWYGAIFFFAKRLTNNTEVAADITSDSFYKLWQLHENFDSLPGIKAFLQVTTRNACLNYLRDTKYRDNARHELHYLASLEANEGMQDISEDERKAQLIKLVYAAIGNLPRKCARIFQLSYLDGLKNTEIARQLNLSEQTVKNQKGRAIKLLKDLITRDVFLFLLWFAV